MTTVNNNLIDLTQHFDSLSQAIHAYRQTAEDTSIDKDIVREFAAHNLEDIIHIGSGDLGFGAYFPDDVWVRKFIADENMVHFKGAWWAMNAHNHPVGHLSIIADDNAGFQFAFIGRTDITKRFFDIMIDNVQASVIGLGKTKEEEGKTSFSHPAITLRGFNKSMIFGDQPDIERTDITEPRKANVDFYPYLNGGPVALIREFMESDAAVMIISGVPGTGKTSAVTAAVVELNLFPVYATSSDVIKHPDFVKTIFKAHDHHAGQNRKKAKAVDTSSEMRKGLMGSFPLTVSIQKEMELRMKEVKAVLPDNTVVEPTELTPIAIVEDCDALMRPRDQGNTQMSDLLNFTNGATGGKHRKIIFTTNIINIDDIEPALLRDGRCFGVYDFRALSPNEAVRARQAAGLPEFEVMPEEAIPLVTAISKPKTIFGTEMLPSSFGGSRLSRLSLN